MYAYTENFVLPISHDEVVHGKGSLLNKMPGDRWKQFANVRTFLGYMFGHPGKKLLFMGCEFAQDREWNHDQSLDWHLLQDNRHAGIQRLVRDLNHLHKSVAALHELDHDSAGFQWIDHGDAERSLLSFVRRGREGQPIMVVVSNFTPTPREGYRLGVPQRGEYVERLNTDSGHYGGSNSGTPLGVASAQEPAWQGQPFSIVINVPPLATVFFECKA
jgi:1,4-alpha-glucan branching enzyme